VLLPHHLIKSILSCVIPFKKVLFTTITANNLADCSGNIIQAINSAKAGLASTIDSFDIVINEVLFNPKPW
jgi:hypothetical protein